METASLPSQDGEMAEVSELDEQIKCIEHQASQAYRDSWLHPYRGDAFRGTCWTIGRTFEYRCSNDGMVIKWAQDSSFPGVGIIYCFTQDGGILLAWYNEQAEWVFLDRTYNVFQHILWMMADRPLDLKKCMSERVAHTVQSDDRWAMTEKAA